MLDLVAKWGPWLLAVLVLLPVVGAWRVWQQRHSLSRRAFVHRLAKSVLWLVPMAICFWLLVVRLAPLTHALVTVQADTGRRVPEILFKRVSDNTPQRLSQVEGKVVLLNLWATYCPPCIQEMPLLVRLQEAYRDSGLVIITLSDEPRERLQKFFQQHPTELLCGYTDSFDWLKIKNFRPFTLVIDRNGILRRHFIGAPSYEELETSIRPYL
jgi:thiol-disulfide isomerase/thioredoxin